MERENNKLMPIIAVIWGISVAGAIICGILECFGVNTGAIGGIFGVITVVPLPLFLLYVIFKGIIN